jgi:desulfoferrodoxin-like iron-binding protein
MSEVINTIKDIASATDFELKHTPNVTVTQNGDTRIVKASIGLKGITHPQTEEHYIEWIQVFCDGVSVGKKDFSPSETPVAEFRIECAGQITVQELCNLHGIWEARA